MTTDKTKRVLHDAGHQAQMLQALFATFRSATSDFFGSLARLGIDADAMEEALQKVVDTFDEAFVMMERALGSKPALSKP